MKALKYSDISLIPEFGQVSSRSKCDTSIKIGEKDYKLPIIPANMKSVISQRHCEWMSRNGYFYIMHRFDIDIFDFVLVIFYGFDVECNVDDAGVFYY